MNNLQLVNRYEEYMKLQSGDVDKIRANTIKAYISDIAMFVEYIKSKNKSLFEADDIDANKWINGMDIKVSTRNRKIAALRGFYNYYIQVQMITFNPFNMVKCIRIKKGGNNSNQDTREYLTKQEYANFEDILNRHKIGRAHV